jgi:hypothetical protein
VPLFVNDGETIRINTKTGEYVERVKEWLPVYQSNDWVIFSLNDV